MRGSLSISESVRSGSGIIPAHAGLTAHHDNGEPCRRDHPRACGAHISRCDRTMPVSGSSPRMRGSLRHELHVQRPRGIIPAHAGLTTCRRSWHLIQRDHPRACGAHTNDSKLVSSFQGSSPRMRGSPGRENHPRKRRGIIPAHAGLTLKNPNIDAILSGPHPVFYSVLRVIR